jgi:DNA polymerase III subunit chi
MADVLFYHLEHKPWEQVLPRLLAQALTRGWRSVIQVGDADKVEQVSEVLWASDADPFLPHGTAADGRAALQPVWITAGDDNPNASSVRFFIEGAALGELGALERAIILIDGADEGAVERARSDWKRLKDEGHAISYWQQDEKLRWINRSAAG